MKHSRPSMKKLAVAAALGLGVSMMSGESARAATDTDNLNVSATVNAACTITGGAVNFGVYDVTAAAANDAQGTISINCSTGAVVYVALGQGANADAASTDAAPVRRMSDGGTNFLGYGLYQDAARNTLWGNTAATAVNSTGTGAAVSLTVYGRIPALQAVGSGSYTDTVIATVNY
jgi:spore coat protein U-like protein